MALIRKRKSTRISNNTISTPSDVPLNVDAATTVTTSRNVKKRKSTTTDTTSSNAKKRKTVADTTSKSAKKQETKTNVAIEPPEQHPASIFKTPDNPRAAFLGLPAELRLQIYAYLCDSSIIHVHSRNETHDKREGKPTAPFTWTPCRAPNPKNPLLCANPKWSGMCDEEDRCTYKFHAPPEPVGFWALAASNKHIRNEAQEFFLRKAVVSIHPHNLVSWLRHLENRTPQQTEHLRRITLAGPNTWRFFTTMDLQLLRERIPNLEAVGVQCQDAVWRWPRSYLSSDVPPRDEDKDAWRGWNVVKWMQEAFDPSITIALEAMVWQQSHQSHEFLEQLVAIRILREAKPGAEGEGKGGWDDDDVKLEIDRSGKLAPRAAVRTAGWRGWWRGKEMKSLTWSLN